MRLLGCALLNSDGCHYKKRILGHRHALREKTHEDPRRRQVVQAKKRRPRRNQLFSILMRTFERLLLNDRTPGFLASGGDEFNPGPETRLDHSELLCNKVVLKYKGDRESF